MSLDDKKTRIEALGCPSSTGLAEKVEVSSIDASLTEAPLPRNSSEPINCLITTIKEIALLAAKRKKGLYHSLYKMYCPSP